MTDADPPQPTAEDLPPEIIALGRAIAQLPGPKFEALEAQYAQVVECFRRRRRVLSLVQESLSQLRLDIKYLMFDLDITRKERDEYRAELDQLQRDDFDVS